MSTFFNVSICKSKRYSLPKHIFYTQYAPEAGHRHCINCGLSKAEVRREERHNRASETEHRIVDAHSDLNNPTFLAREDFKINK